MELEAALIIVSVIFAAPLTLFMVLKYKPLRQDNTKRQKKSREETLESYVSQTVRELQESYEARIKMMKDEILSLQKSNARYKGLMRKYEEPQDDDEDDQQIVNIEKDYDIDWVKAAQVGNQLGLDTSKFDPNNPVLTNYFKDKIIENKDLALFMGILKPKGTNTVQGGSVNTGSSSGEQSIFDSPEAQNFPSL